jgi:hypothetical protein
MYKSLEALQEIRKYRWQAIDQENEAMEKRNSLKRFEPILLANHDTVKQLLARSRYFLYKNKSKWSKTKQPEPKYYLNCILILKEPMI